jgi:hypothetical protein
LRERPETISEGDFLDKSLVAAGLSLSLAGLTGLFYGVGINLQGMLARGAPDFSFITAYIAEWLLVFLAGLALAIGGARKK